MMYDNYKDIIDTSLVFLKKINITTPLVCDHICYRVTSLEEYETAKAEALKISDLITETMVRGRPICIFKFFKPIQYEGLSISCLELPAPKPGSLYKKGFEHLEFVVKDLQVLIDQNAGFNFDISGINRAINPEIALAVSANYNLKFHPLHILDVIEIEKNQNITEVN